jgi:serine-type D-Ala-D-Ala carboxypeptidase (penicillin-binding protein 5/6)
MNRRTFLTTTSLSIFTPGAELLAAPRSSAKPKEKVKEKEPATEKSTEKEQDKPAEKSNAITVNAAAACLIDAYTGKVLYAKDAAKERQVASTQKLMTALILCESGNLDRICTVEEYETKAPPTKLFIKIGQQYPRKELMKAMLIKSANDCAMCLGRSHGGSEEGFAEMMNRRAAQLGMKQSHFMNPSGLPAEQYSTAYDMALLGRAALFQPAIRDIIAMRKATFNHADGKPRQLENTNELLHLSPYCHGMKTGYTEAAGKCLVSCASHKGRTVICVMLGSSLKYIWKESRTLLHAGLGVA